MPKIEIGAQNVPNTQLLKELSGYLERELMPRNNFVGGSDAFDVSRTIRMPHQSLEAGEDMPGRYSVLHHEQRIHLRTLTDLGIANARELQNTALIVNHTTEVNLPQYVDTMNERARDAAKEDSDASAVADRWVRTWAAEEVFHSLDLRDLARGTGAVTDRELDLATVAVMTTPLNKTVQAASLPELHAYLMAQELATVVSHNNTAYLFGPLARRELMRIGANESTHHELILGMVALELSLDPEYTVQAIWRQFRNFAMPGEGGIPNYPARQEELSIAGIFDFPQLLGVFGTCLNKLNVESLSLSGDAARAQEALLNYVDPNSSVNRRLITGLQKKRDERIGRASSLVPLILGQTVVAEKGKPLARV